MLINRTPWVFVEQRPAAYVPVVATAVAGLGIHAMTKRGFAAAAATAASSATSPPG